MSRLILAGVLLAFSVPALAGSFAGSSAGASSAGSSASSGSSSGDDKVVVQAREDAASFVATEGRIRGAQLEAALRHLREKDEAARKASGLTQAELAGLGHRVLQLAEVSRQQFNNKENQRHP